MKSWHTSVTIQTRGLGQKSRNIQSRNADLRRTARDAFLAVTAHVAIARAVPIVVGRDVACAAPALGRELVDITSDSKKMQETGGERGGKRQNTAR